MTESAQSDATWGLVIRNPDVLVALGAQEGLRQRFTGLWWRYDLVHEEVSALIVPDDGKAFVRGAMPPGVDRSDFRWTKDDTLVLENEKDVTVIRKTGPYPFAQVLPLLVTAPPKGVGPILGLFEDEASFARALSLAVHLGDLSQRPEDAQYAALASGEHLLLLAQGSVFLAEDWAVRGHEVFAPSEAGTWCPPGSVHPWARWLTPNPAKTLQLVGHQGWRTLDRSLLQPAMDRVRLVSTASPVSAHVLEPTRYEIELKLEPESRSASPSVWLIRGESSRIETLLRTLDADALATLRFAALRDDTGPLFLVVRSMHTAQTELEFGQAFSFHAELGTLALPVGTRLVPEVGRSHLRASLEMQPNEMTLLVPNQGQRGEQTNGYTDFHRLVVPQSALGPISDCIDYVVHAERRAVSAFVDASILDLSDLTRFASSGSVMAPASEPTASESDDNPEDAALAAADDELRDAQPEPTAEAEPADDPKPPGAGEGPANEVLVVPTSTTLDAALERAQREAFAAFTDPKPWANLATRAFDARDKGLALGALEHALFVCDPADANIETLWTRWVSLLPPAAKSVLASPHDLWDLDQPKKRALLLWVYAHRDKDEDPIEATKLCEAILSDLRFQGIEERDSFPFIRRLVREHFGSRQLPTAYQELVAYLSQEAEAIETPEIRVEAFALISMAFDASQHRDGAMKWLSAASGIRLRPGQGALAAATLGAAKAALGVSGAESHFEDATNHLRKMRTGLDRDLALTRCLRLLERANLVGGERALALRALHAVAEEPVYRRAMQLADNTGLFADLGVVDEVLEMLEKLFEEEELYEDAYDLTSALRAYREASAKARLPADRLQKILATIVENDVSAADPGALGWALAHSNEALLSWFSAFAEEADWPERFHMRTALALAQIMGQKPDLAREETERLLAEVWAAPTSEALKLGLQQCLLLLASSTPSTWVDEALYGLIDGVAAHLGDRLPQSVLRSVLSAFVEAVAQVAGAEHAPELSRRSLQVFTTMLERLTHQTSAAFEFVSELAPAIDGLDDEAASAILHPSLKLAKGRLERPIGTENPYFAYLAWVRCATAILRRDRAQGQPHVIDFVTTVANATHLSARDRVELCEEVCRGLAFLETDEVESVAMLRRLTKTALNTSRRSSFTDKLARDYLVSVVDELVQRDSAYRKELVEVRAREETLIRRRVLSHYLQFSG